MSIGLTVLTGPSAEPVTLTEAKIHCRVSSLNTIEDDLVSGLIVSAREHIEHVADRSLPSKRYVLNLDGFDSCFRLPRPPLQAVESIKYLDLDGDQQTLASTVYRVDTASDPGRITLADEQSWPTVLHTTNAVEITYVAGFGPVTSSPAMIPAGVSIVTPRSMLGIYVGTVIAVDVGELTELVTVTAKDATTFTATFAWAHGATVRLNGVPRGYQSAMKLLIYDWYWTRGDTPPPGLTGLAMPNGVQAILQSLGHGAVF